MTPDDERPHDDDAELLARMIAEDPAALREYFDRFAPALLRVAQRARVPRAERRNYVHDVLADVAMRLVGQRAPPSVAIMDYLARSFRNRLLRERRSCDRRDRAEEAAAGRDEEVEGVVLTMCSQHQRRASQPPMDGDPPLHPAVAGLHVALCSTLGDEDRRVMEWISERVPQREIAEWIGTTHGALRVRVNRLRKRLATIANAYMEGLEPADRERVLRMLTRGDGSALRRMAQLVAARETRARVVGEINGGPSVPEDER